MPTPPPAYAFASLPAIEDRADRIDPDALGPRLAGGAGYLGFARNGWQETIGVDMMSGRVEQVVVLPRSSFLPLWSGLATGAFVLALLFKVYWLAIVMLAVTVASLMAWTSATARTEDVGPLPVGRGEEAPPHWETERPPSWWATVFTLSADATLFASLIFGALFLWVVAPGWPPAQDWRPALPVLALAFAALVGAAIAGRRALSDLAGGTSPGAALVLCGAAHLVATGALALLAFSIPDPTGHAHRATMVVILAYAAIHAAVGALFALHGLMRHRGGFLSPRRSIDLRIGRLWHDYTLVAGLLAVAACTLMAMLGGAAGEAR
jgi:cytochrome c oxidase subunit I+III